MKHRQRLPLYDKRDQNEDEIIYALRQAGATVSQISATGVPDLLIGFRGVTYLIDCKTRNGRMTPAQTIWFEAWRGGRIGIVRTIGEALTFIGAVEEDWRGAD